MPPNLKDDNACLAAHRRFLASTSRGFSQEWQYAWINDLTLYGPKAIVGWTAKGSLNGMTKAYLERPDVRAALHVTRKDGTPFDTWPGPSREEGGGWEYHSNYAACNALAPNGTNSMVWFYRQIAPKLETTIVFNGDTDPCVSYEGTRAAILKVGFKETEGGSYRPWFFNMTAAAASLLAEKPLLFGPSLALQAGGPQFGGHVVNYEHGLSFVTVHGAGHMVPQFRPRAGLHLLDKLLSGRPFSPALSVNITASDDAFDDALDAWTLKAQAPPYVPLVPATPTPEPAAGGGSSDDDIKKTWLAAGVGIGAGSVLAIVAAVGGVAHCRKMRRRRTLFAAQETLLS